MKSQIPPHNYNDVWKWQQKSQNCTYCWKKQEKFQPKLFEYIVVLFLSLEKWNLKNCMSRIFLKETKSLKTHNFNACKINVFFHQETKFCKFPIPQQIIIPPSLHPSLLWSEFLPLLTTNRLISKQNKIGCHFSPIKKMKSNNSVVLNYLLKGYLSFFPIGKCS